MYRPIHDAIDVGSLELVKLLIQHGADPLAEQGDKTPIEIAFDRNLPEIHSYLQCKTMHLTTSYHNYYNYSGMRYSVIIVVYMNKL